MEKPIDHKDENRRPENTSKERESTLGRAVGDMAHYIKNILNGLEGGVYMVNTGLKRERQELLTRGWNMVEKNVIQISDLALNMIIYSKGWKPEPELCSPNDIAEEALDILKKRGYKLALYSNASVHYFRYSVSVLNIGDYFDYAECTQDNDLSKLELVRKIQGKFQDMKAAVIGDRIHDIEAAQSTKSLSIGVLYGYGGKEPEKAHITIRRFPELLDIFNRKLPSHDPVL